jgi:hypothetical protein
MAILVVLSRAHVVKLTPTSAVPSAAAAAACSRRFRPRPPARRGAQAPLLLRTGAGAQRTGREPEIGDPLGFGRQPRGQRELRHRRVVGGAAERAGGLAQPQRVEAQPIGESGPCFDAPVGLGPALVARMAEQQLVQRERISRIVCELGVATRQQLQILPAARTGLGVGVDERTQLARGARAIVGDSTTGSAASISALFPLPSAIAAMPRPSCNPCPEKELKASASTILADRTARGARRR